MTPTLFSNQVISVRFPDFVLVNKETKQTFLINVACVMKNILTKEKKMVEKYVLLLWIYCKDACVLDR